MAQREELKALNNSFKQDARSYKKVLDGITDQLNAELKVVSKAEGKKLKRDANKAKELATQDFTELTDKVKAEAKRIKKENDKNGFLTKALIAVGIGAAVFVVVKVLQNRNSSAEQQPPRA